MAHYLPRRFEAAGWRSTILANFLGAILATTHLTPPAHAVMVSYDNWLNGHGDASLLVRVSPTAFGEAHPPSYLDMTGDVDTGLLSITRWDIYDDASNNIVYSLGPHAVSDLVHQPDGKWRGSITTPEGPWSVKFGRFAAPISQWELSLAPLTEWFVDEIVLTFEPLYRPFKIVRLTQVGEVPEPSTIGLLLAGTAIASLARRQTNRRGSMTGR